MNSLSLQKWPIASKYIHRNRSLAHDVTRQSIHFLPFSMLICLHSPISHYELQVNAKFTDVIALWFGPSSDNCTNGGHFRNSHLFASCICVKGCNVRTGVHDTSDLNTENYYTQNVKTLYQDWGCARRSTEEISREQEGLIDTQKSRRVSGSSSVVPTNGIRGVSKTFGEW
jgi:hypothetical protein